MVTINRLFAIPILRIAILLFATTSVALGAFANDSSESSSKQPSLQTSSNEEPTNELQSLRQKIEKRANVVSKLEKRASGESGINLQVLSTRLSNAREKLIEDELNFVKTYLEQQESSSGDLTAYRKQALDFLISHPPMITNIKNTLIKRIKIPDQGLSAADENIAYYKVFDGLKKLNRLYELFFQSIELAKKMGLDVTNNEKTFKYSLEDRAANIAILLELASEEVRALKSAVAILPQDQNLKDKLSITENRAINIASALSSVVSMMNHMDMEASNYSELIIAATGQITTDTLDTGVMTRLVIGWSEKLTGFIIEDGPDIFLKFLFFIGIIFVFFKLSNVVKSLVRSAIDRSNTHLSMLLKRMLVSTAGNLVLMLGILIALSQIGISLGPLLAGLGVAGFVIGFAMQDVLSNFASGMMILVYRPFDVGDLVETGGVFGTVSHMSLVSTTILTLDNQTIVVPNNKIWGDVIKNLTFQRTRRVDLMFGISYTDDVEKAEEILHRIVDEEERIFDEPKPLIHLHELGESSVNFIVRPWVKTEDYWDVYWHLMRTVKLTFDAEGISIPFPQRDMNFSSNQPISIRLEKDS